MNHIAILKLADKCNSHRIIEINELLEAGLSPLAASQLVRTYISDESTDETTLYRNGFPVHYATGIYSLDLLHYLAEYVGADLGRVLMADRRQLADEYKKAIRERIESVLA